MGLTKNSVGTNAIDSEFIINKQNQKDKIIALAGNPNVGKSTVFNGLTGMKQHTGNWPGKTVTGAWGYCNTDKNNYILVDIPGTYSLIANSAEEEVARNFICFGGSDAVIVVCDSTCLERNLNLVLQIMEISDNVIVCANLMDEANRKNIKIDLKKLSERLGVPVISTVAREKKSIAKLINTVDKSMMKLQKEKIKITYPQIIEKAIETLMPYVEKISQNKINSRWLCIKMLDMDNSLAKELEKFLGINLYDNKELIATIEKVKEEIYQAGISEVDIKNIIVTSIVQKAEEICKGVVFYDTKSKSQYDRKADRLFTGKYTAFPIMIIFLAFIFWLTIVGANYPSQILSEFLFGIEDKLTEFFIAHDSPKWLHGILVLGVYRVVAWVVSVMLPPMAMFFPLFTLLEDVGYLPRIAYNLDKPFKKCTACGKQSLTMCMGFGCNAAGVIGCRIIDTERERLLAILTNNFVPCNGRFPTLISIITMFFLGSVTGIWSSLSSACLLTAVIVLGVFTTFMITKLLSKTLLKGRPSTFILEMPPYRRPQVAKVITRSIFDRTLFVLARAVVVAAPAGAIIWIMANINIDGQSILNVCASFLEPLGNIMGLDGIILMAFILGFPANEIVIPIMIMAYTAQGNLVDMQSAAELKALLLQNGWTHTTAICTMLFSIMHWPCSTTILTIKKETNSNKWTFLAAIIPTITGIVCCVIVNFISKIFI